MAAPVYIFSLVILFFVAFVSSYEDLMARFGGVKKTKGEKDESSTKLITISNIDKNK